MKKNTCFIIALFLIYISAFSHPYNVSFVNLTLIESYKKAQIENKKIMLYFELENCIPCLKMERETFEKPKVSSFITEHFICLKINSKQDTFNTARSYNIQNYPTIVFLDENGHLLNKIVGFYTDEDFLKEASNAFLSKNSIYGYEQKYKSGDRSQELLYSYCYQLKLGGKYDPLMIGEYLNTLSDADLKNSKNINFIFDFALDGFDPLISFHSREFKFLYSNRNLFYKYLKTDLVNERIVFIIYDEMYKAIEQQDSVLFEKTTEYMKPFDNKKSHELKDRQGNILAKISSSQLILSAQIEFYKKNGNLKKAATIETEFTKAIWNNADELFLNAKFIENPDDSASVSKAIKYIKRSVELKDNYSARYIYADLLFNSGKYSDARIQVQKAIELAKKDHADFTFLETFLKTIDIKLE